MTQISRRSIAKGSAWAVPAIALASSAPAATASQPTDAFGCTAEDQAKIQEYVLTTYPALLPDYSGAIIRAQHNQTLLAIDGTTQQDYINFYNVGSKAVDFSSFPFTVRVDLVRDPSSTNSNVAEKRAWNIDGSTTDMNITSSNGRYYSAQALPGTSDVPGDANGTMTFYTQLKESLTPVTYSNYIAPTANSSTLTIQWQDGIAAGGRIKNAVILSPQGYSAPSPATVQAATGITITGGKCEEAYWAAVEQWNANNVGMRGLVFEQAAPNAATTFNWYDADPSKTITVSTVGGTMDSRTTGNFNSGGGSTTAMNGIF